MQRISTTVVAIVGAGDTGAAVRHVGAATNVLGVVPEEAGPLDRAVAAWREAVRSKRTYVVHDADPLAAVADAWVRRYDAGGAVGDLEVAVAETVQRWRSRSLELPDYYMVLDPDALPATRRHWFLGYLRASAPTRVAVVGAGGDEVVARIGRLRPGRWWPDLDRLLDRVDVVPDRVSKDDVAAAETALV